MHRSAARPCAFVFAYEKRTCFLMNQLILSLKTVSGRSHCNLFLQVKHDFVAFARMFLIFMIAGGVTIQAILYPNWPITVELIRRVLTRPIYSMFLTPIQDLDGMVLCIKDSCI